MKNILNFFFIKFLFLALFSNILLASSANSKDRNFEGLGVAHHQELFFKAIKKGDAEKVKKLLEERLVDLDSSHAAYKDETIFHFFFNNWGSAVKVSDGSSREFQEIFTLLFSQGVVLTPKVKAYQGGKITPQQGKKRMKRVRK